MMHRTATSICSRPFDAKAGAQDTAGAGSEVSQQLITASHMSVEAVWRWPETTPEGLSKGENRPAGIVWTLDAWGRLTATWVRTGAPP
jgi:hypothetical protein